MEKTASPPAANLPLKQHTHSVALPAQFVHLNEGVGKPLLIFIHGYADSGPSFLRRVFPSLDERYEILAPNGLFPLPQRSESGWKEAYAWYFADLAAKKIMIHPKVSAVAIAHLVEQLGLEEREKILCGFSQGGYFLPHLAKELKGVKRLIAIGAGFRLEDFKQFGLRLPVSAIHGDADEVIPMEQSRKEFSELSPWNLGGEFVVIPGMTHTVDSPGREAFLALLGQEV